MTSQEFLAEYGWTPSVPEIRIANGYDPNPQNLGGDPDRVPYDPSRNVTVEMWKKHWSNKRDGKKTEPARAAEPKAADFPCRHRGRDVPDAERKSPAACDLCGVRGQPFSVHSCSKFGECSIGRKHSKVKSCVSCTEREVEPAIKRDPPTKTLTIGMATFDDAARVRWTINALRETHARELRDAGYSWEIVVVNNNPKPGDDYSNHSRHLRIFNESSDPPVRVIDFGEKQGTFPPKAHVFDVARGEWVIVIDCHCLIRAGALKESLDWLTAHREFDGLIHGVLIGDSGQRLYTHQEREYRDNMLAMWQNYNGPDANLPNNARPSEWAEVKSVPQHGAFLFGCRRDAWPTDKIPKGLRGFGGDENVDALFRSLGRKVVTFDWLHVWHDFIRMDQLYGFERTISTALVDRLRNDVLWLIASGETHRVVEALEHYQVAEQDKRSILREIGLWKPEGSKAEGSKINEDRLHLPRISSPEVAAQRGGKFRFTSRLGRARA